MAIPPDLFDVRLMDSDQLGPDAPARAAARLKEHLLPSAHDDLAKNIEEHRLRLYSSAVLAAHLPRPGNLPPWAWELDALVRGVHSFDATDAALLGPGLWFMRIEEWLVILLPPAILPLHVDLTVAALNDLQHAFPMIRHWTIDFAAVTDLPSALVGYLIGFNHGLKSSGCDMALLWMQHSVIPPGLLMPMVKHFNLESRGAFYLSMLRH